MYSVVMVDEQLVRFRGRHKHPLIPKHREQGLEGSDRREGLHT